MCRTADNNEHRMQSPKLKGYIHNSNCVLPVDFLVQTLIKKILTKLEHFAGKKLNSKTSENTKNASRINQDKNPKLNLNLEPVVSNEH